MKPTMILAILALLVFAWMFRYEVIVGGSTQLIVRLDRWTGSLYELNHEQLDWVRVDGGKK